jgi:hypothetical protein
MSNTFVQAANTGSALFSGANGFGSNVTNTAIATNIVIAVRTPNGYVPVGAVQSMAISEKRPIKMIDEVGTDGHIDSVPNQSTSVTGTCQRVRFQALRVANAFDRGFVHVASQVYPFDIIIIDKQKADITQQVSTVIKNVWISGIDYTYQVSDWVITDSMTWEAETIFSFLNGGNGANFGSASAATLGQGNLLGGQPPFGFQGGTSANAKWVETQTDTGAAGRRGSLDASGLIDIGTGNSGQAFDTSKIF